RQGGLWTWVASKSWKPAPPLPPTQEINTMNALPEKLTGAENSSSATPAEDQKSRGSKYHTQPEALGVTGDGSIPGKDHVRGDFSDLDPRTSPPNLTETPQKS